jgi:hypothetical protein
MTHIPHDAPETGSRCRRRRAVGRRGAVLVLRAVSTLRLPRRYLRPRDGVNRLLPATWPRLAVCPVRHLQRGHERCPVGHRATAGTVR